jgi:hypothetical protein
VLKTRTSEKNGLAAEPTGSDVTAGSVKVSPLATPERRGSTEAMRSALTPTLPQREREKDVSALTANLSQREREKPYRVRMEILS